MSKRYLVKAGDSLQDAIVQSPPGSTLLVEGDHTAEGTIDIERSRLVIENNGDAVVDRFRQRGTVGEVHIRGVRFENNTPPASNTNYALHMETSIDCSLSEAEITGHGYNYGVRMSNTERAENFLMERCHVWEIENKAGFLIGDGHQAIGNHIHDLYRTVSGNGFLDVDAFNFMGNGHVYAGNHIHSIDLADSISTVSPGRANPGGPLGVDGPPHCDAFQTFTVYKDIAGTIPWTTHDALIVGNFGYKLVGQGVILESNRVASPSLISNAEIAYNSFFVRNSYQNINLRGTLGAKVHDNFLGMGEINGGRMVWFQPSSDNGNPTNVNPEVYNNLCFGMNNSGNTGNLLEGDGTYSVDLVHYNNVLVDGDFDDVLIYLPEIGSLDPRAEALVKARRRARK